MDIEILKQELTEDEGCKYEIYLDHLGYKTFGIRLSKIVLYYMMLFMLFQMKYS